MLQNLPYFIHRVKLKAARNEKRKKKTFKIWQILLGGMYVFAIQLKERQLLLLSTIYKAGEIVTVAEHEKKDEEKYSDTDPDGLLMAKSHATHKSACVCVCMCTYLPLYYDVPSES